MHSVGGQRGSTCPRECCWCLSTPPSLSLQMPAWRGWMATVLCQVQVLHFSVISGQRLNAGFTSMCYSSERFAWPSCIWSRKSSAKQFWSSLTTWPQLPYINKQGGVMAHSRGWVMGTPRSSLPCRSTKSWLGRTNCIGVCVHTSYSPCLTRYSWLCLVKTSLRLNPLGGVVNDRGLGRILLLWGCNA